MSRKGSDRAGPESSTSGSTRSSRSQSYGEAAGFTGFEVLPIEELGFWRFYRLF
ncbi:hypothetical protein ACFVJS_08805 [Nocardioides sp. NPDC057772]|uniref:hypothetical protein n=1 Tax=Nocardioides sp. NPDC057772 TaxID=3346245 RepID=UPI00366D6234